MNLTVRIRAMTREDIDEVLEIERASFPDPWSRDAFHATLLLPYAHYYVAELREERQSAEATSRTQEAALQSSEAAPHPPEAAQQTLEAAQRTPKAAVPLVTRIVAECGVRDIMGEGEITNVAVHPDFRGQGIARQMMKHVLQDSLIKGMTAFTLEVRAGNQPAIALYERFGFRTEGIRQAFYEDPVEDALIMWLRQK